MDPRSCISHLHEEELLNDDVFLWDIPSSSDQPDHNFFINSMLEEQQPILITRSAFVKYMKPNHHSSPAIIITDRDNGTTNVHHRLMHMLKDVQKNQAGINEKMMYKKNECSSRGFRHLMRERQRREKMSQSYADLHSMLPHCPKTDKISIVQAATAYVKDREMVKEALMKRNMQLTDAAKLIKKEKRKGQKIRICIADHVSALESMIGAVRRLKEMTVEATSIQTHFSDHERIAVVNVVDSILGKI